MQKSVIFLQPGFWILPNISNTKLHENITRKFGCSMCKGRWACRQTGERI